MGHGLFWRILRRCWGYIGWDDDDNNGLPRLTRVQSGLPELRSHQARSRGHVFLVILDSRLPRV